MVLQIPTEKHVQKLSASMPTELEFLRLEAAGLVGMLDAVTRLQRRSGRLAGRRGRCSLAPAKRASGDRQQYGSNNFFHMEFLSIQKWIKTYPQAADKRVKRALRC